MPGEKIGGKDPAHTARPSMQYAGTSQGPSFSRKAINSDGGGGCGEGKVKIFISTHEKGVQRRKADAKTPFVRLFDVFVLAISKQIPLCNP